MNRFPCVIMKKCKMFFFEITNIFREKGGCDLLKEDEIFYFLMTKETKGRLASYSKGRLASYYMAANLLGLHLGEKATLLTIKSEKKKIENDVFSDEKFAFCIEKSI